MFTKAFALDLLERALSTFAQAFLAALVVTGWSVDSLIVGGTAAGLAVLKGLAASQVGAHDSASLLPADVDPPTDDEGGMDLGAAAVFLIVVLAVIAGGLILRHI